MADKSSLKKNQRRNVTGVLFLGIYSTSLIRTVGALLISYW